MRKGILFIATGAGSGYSPIAPGTAGSAVGIAIWWAGVWGLGAGFATQAIAVGVITAVGIWAAGEAERIWGTHDDGRITIDEVAGQGVALLLLPTESAGFLVVGVVSFFLFRLFDIVKPAPARSFEALPGGLGVVADDLMAGVYANLVGQLVFRFAWPLVFGAAA